MKKGFGSVLGCAPGWVASLVLIAPGAAFAVVKGFQVIQDGAPVANTELTPGTKLKAVVKTTATPKVVKVTEVKEGTIVSIVGQNVTIRTADGVKMFRNVPSSLHFTVHGKKVPINQITEGMRITATYVVEEVDVDVEQANRKAVLRLEGAATFIRLPVLAEALEQVPGNAELHVDFEHLDYIDHACLDLLINWDKQHEATGGTLVIDWDTLHANFRRENGNRDPDRKRFAAKTVG